MKGSLGGDLDNIERNIREIGNKNEGQICMTLDREGGAL
jgi:hypothetical protein